MIKILTKKQWRMINNKIRNLNSDLFSTKVSLDCYIDRVCKQKIVINNLEKEKRLLSSSKGGLNAKIKRLEKKLEILTISYNELEEKYKESMTDKYLVKKIPSGRPPKGNKMKLKDCSRVSNITMKYIGDYNE